jgi:hypothetical protein
MRAMARTARMFNVGEEEVSIQEPVLRIDMVFSDRGVLDNETCIDLEAPKAHNPTENRTRR